MVNTHLTQQNKQSLFSCSGAHISLWTEKEELPNSAKSISKFEGQEGEFWLRQFRIIKNRNTTLLLGYGEYLQYYSALSQLNLSGTLKVLLHNFICLALHVVSNLIKQILL